jgi:nucleotide-binding universal stress UspA family protein
VLLCFDGSGDAAAAIARAAELLASHLATVLTVWQPMRTWDPFDPLTALSAPLERLVLSGEEFDRVIEQIAHERLDRGLQLARAAGFEAEGRLARGKPWREICAAADQLDAATIVLGARGLGRVEATLLGSVSTAVLFHARRSVLVVEPQAGD